MGETLQRLILILRKLNVLRYGYKTYSYTSGRDMPARALLDDVYDEEKDLLTLTKNQETHQFCTRCGAKLSPGAGLCAACNLSLNR